MTKPVRMSEDDLKALVGLEIRNAVGYYGDKLSEQRRKATLYYQGKPEEDLAPPEIEGRSAVVDTYVRNTIEAMLPQLMARFTGGDSVVEFEAQTKDDEQKAKVCTDYLNYLFWKKNPGHLIAETWMRDALLYKVGVLKVWWDTRIEETKEEYKGLTEVELAQILDDKEVEPTEHKYYPSEEDAEQRQEAIQQLTQQLQQASLAAQQNPQAAQAVMGIQQHIQAIQAAPPVMLCDITVKRTRKGGKLSIENVPPEEFLISKKAKNIVEASFVCHRVQRTISDLRSMGYPEAVLENVSGDGNSFNAERTERDDFDSDASYTQMEDTNSDPSQRRVWIEESYIRCDFNGDGISELRKVTTVGNNVLDNEEVDIAPFVHIICVRQPHKFQGLSIADLGMETQKTKTSILRSMLDNMYLQVNGRYFAVDGQVNLDDLLTSRPGGVVRVKSRDATGRLDQALGDAQAGMGMLEYMEQFGEAATGWTRNSQGNAAGPLMAGTATGANIIAAKDDMRLDLIARNFAEGFVELFRQMLKAICQNQDKKSEVRLAGQWVDIDPREWRNQFDVNISVGLGVGSKDQQIAHMMALIAQQEKVAVLGVAMPENIYNASVELAKLIGQKNGDKFFTDPAKLPPQQPKPDPELIKAQTQVQVAQAQGQVTMQVEAAKLQANSQLARLKAELDAQVAAANQEAQARQETLQQQIQAQIEAHKATLAAQSAESERQQQLLVEQMRIAAENARKEQDNYTKILVAQIASQTQTTEAQIAAEQKADATLAGIQNENLKAKVEDLTGQLSAPKTVIRDERGKPIGVQHGDKFRTVKRDENGRVIGLQ